MEKFDFNRDFQNGDNGAAAVPSHRQARSAKLEQAHAEGYAAGCEDAVAQAAHRQADALDQLANVATQLLNTVQLEMDQARDESTRLGAHIARRFVEHHLASQPEDFLERAIEACMEVARREPQLKIEIPDDLGETLEPRLRESLEANGLASQVLIVTSSALAGVHCQLEWMTGGATVAADQVMDEIDRVVEEHVSALQLSRQETNLQTDPQEEHVA